MTCMLQSLNIRSLQLCNRLIMPPMATGKAGTNGSVNQAILDYYSEKSEGGYVSAVITEHAFISQEGKASKNQLSIADDSMVEELRKLANAVHGNGSKAIVQINHAGSLAFKAITGKVPVGPSRVENLRKVNELPHELIKSEIADIVTSFQNAAARVQKAGFDGVEIHCAHGYLLNQFFSPLTNKRKDEYGGNVMNRIRIHIEVIKAVRQIVGKDFPIFLRLGASDYTEGGTTIDDSVVAAREFEKIGVDVLDISGGFCGYTIPGNTNGQGYFAPLTERLKREVSTPVILTGGITQAKVAEQLLSDGKADLIGIGRAILNDSTWAKHAMESFCNSKIYHKHI